MPLLAPVGFFGRDAAGTASVTVAGVPSSAAAGTPTPAAGSVSASPAGLASTSTAGAPTSTPGSASATATGIASTATAGTSTPAPGSVSATATGPASTATAGTSTAAAASLARQYYSASAATRQSSTTNTAQGTYDTATTLTFTPDANAAYWVILSATVDAPNSNTAGYVRLYDSSTSTTLAESFFTVFSSSDVGSVTLLARVAASSSPTSHALRADFTSSGAFGSMGIQDVLIVAIKAAAADQYVESRAQQTTTSTTYQTACTLSFTPATAGAYVVIAACTYTTSGNSGLSAKVRLTDGTTSYSELTSSAEKNGTGSPTWQHAHLTGSLSGAQAWSIQYGRSGAISDTIKLQDTAILALRADALPGVLAARTTTAATTTSTTAQTFLTGTLTPAAYPTLALGTFVGGANGPINVRLSRGGTNTSPAAVTLNRQGGTTAVKSWSNGLGRLLTPPGTSQAWALQYFSTTAGTTSGLDEGSIVLIQLGAP